MEDNKKYMTIYFKKKSTLFLNKIIMICTVKLKNNIKIEKIIS